VDTGSGLAPSQAALDAIIGKLQARHGEAYARHWAT
jgi:hypothetical protein